jgi:hypothetical protein
MNRYASMIASRRSCGGSVRGAIGLRSTLLPLSSGKH